MGNKSSEPVKKPNLKEIAAILMQYPFQPVILKDGRTGRVQNYGPDLINCVCKEAPCHNVVFNNDISVLVKQLERISKEDSEYVRKLIKGDNVSEILEAINNDLASNCIYNRASILLSLEGINLIDYLRERGYALPYKNWSVEQLVAFEVYKLTE